MALDAEKLMRTGTRVSPSWPGLEPEAGYVEADRSRRTRRNHLQRGGEFLKYPLRQIDQPPAHHAVDRRDRTTFDHAGKCSTLTVVELGWLPRRLAVQETIRPSCVEA